MVHYMVELARVGGGETVQLLILIPNEAPVLSS